MASTSRTPSPSPSPPNVTFPLSPVPENPLGAGRFVRTAAALVIGDEILNGRTMDTNSHYFAQKCFELGIDLKRIEVVPDDEANIVEASRRMTQDYDFVISSGGIGPTHDDITYASLAKAFGQPVVHHKETLSRMAAMSMYRKAFLDSQTEEQRTARERMALFPEKAEVLFVVEDMWVPVIRLEGKLCVFPGIPTLFKRLLDGLLSSYVPLPPERPSRVQIFTTLPESSIAPFLTSLQKEVHREGVRIGSYPVLRKGVTVSLIGTDETRLKELSDAVCTEIQGKIVV